MICLDTNYLIRALVPDTPEAARLVEWNANGELLLASAVVWYEFVCGPVDAQQIAIIRTLLHEIVPFDAAQAREAARLFHSGGRRRSSRVDAMVAAAATSRQAPLATGNLADFRPFVDSGLKLVD